MGRNTCQSLVPLVCRSVPRPMDVVLQVKILLKQIRRPWVGAYPVVFLYTFSNSKVYTIRELSRPIPSAPIDAIF